ncbi:hypothetical protein KM043_004384 [Ampulex compressa]|nr:hypothetical protein KM043_004384 [Ampulex compressa]
MAPDEQPLGPIPRPLSRRIKRSPGSVDQAKSAADSKVRSILEQKCGAECAFGEGRSTLVPLPGRCFEPGIVARTPLVSRTGEQQVDAALQKHRGNWGDTKFWRARESTIMDRSKAGFTSSLEVERKKEGRPSGGSNDPPHVFLPAERHNPVNNPRSPKASFRRTIKNPLPASDPKSSGKPSSLDPPPAPPSPKQAFLIAIPTIPHVSSTCHVN